MVEHEKFEEEEEALFADDDTTTHSTSKGARLVDSKTMSDFMAWLYDIHPEIRGVYQLNYRNIQALVAHFERSNGYRSGYTAEEWLKSLQQ